MRQGKVVTRAFTIFAVIGLVMSVFTACTPRGVSVIITNDGDKPITDLSIGLTGGKHLVPELAPKSSHRLSIKPTGESSLHFEFVDSAGNRRSEQIDVYFEPGYSGTVHIRVDAAGEVTWESEIEVR